MITRFMQTMFSAVENEDAELTKQVADDVEAAKSSESGIVDTDEVTYVNLGSGKVLVTDKENGESTVIENDPEDAESYSLEGIENDEELEKYLHTLDGTTPDESVQTEETENAQDHMTGEDVIAPNQPDGGLNPQAGSEPSVTEVCPECGNNPCTCEGEKEFSVTTDNSAVLKIFSEVITEDKPAIIGDIKVEKCEECPDSVIVTDINSGDAAKVTLEDEDMVVTEVQKEFQHDYSDLEGEENGQEQYEPLYVVGLDPEEHVLVDSPVYDEEDAQVLAQRLEEDGVEGVNIFEDPDEAREYAVGLLGEVGVSEVEQIAEPEAREFSDCTLYLTRYFSEEENDYSDCTNFMFKLFSEAEEGNPESQDKIEDAIESGEQIETNDEVITPVDAKTAVVEDKDNGEFTKVTLDGEDMDTEAISEEEADELTDNLGVEEEKEYSEYISDYMTRLYSNDDMKEDIEDALESGEQVENSSEVITPVDSETAVVEDKSNGEFTKVKIDGEDLDTTAITEEEADELTDGLAVDDENEEDNPEEEEEKEYSEEEEMDEFTPLARFFGDIEQQQMAEAPQGAVDPNQVDPQTGDPVQMAPVDQVQGESVEGIEDKALAAVQSIQEAANDAVLAIQQAKEAPAPGEEQDLQEAQFSETEDYYESGAEFNPLVDWLQNK